MIHLTDTIAAISTPAGAGGIGIVRISGANAGEILAAVFIGKNIIKTFRSHMMYYGHIKNGQGDTVDEVLACFMAAPRTYTKENVVEIHCHGGLHCVKGVLETVLAAGARLAEPGEFTKRAFLNGRLDLSQAEAVMDVINAKTDSAKDAALNQLSGRLSEACTAMAEDILNLLAHIEASIDYPEHDMEAMNLKTIKQTALKLVDRLQSLLNTANQGKILREGLTTAIIGRPNVGKSSLLNALAGEERAIVTDLPGTTRDVLTEWVNLGGIPLQILDTAGMRESGDKVEAIGIQRAKETALKAEFLLVLLDASQPLTQDDRDILNMVAHKKRLLVLNKTDLPQQLTVAELAPYAPGEDVVAMSLKANEGLEALTAAITRLFNTGRIAVDNQPLVTNVRHEQALKQCIQSLKNAVDTIDAGFFEDLVSVDLQAAYGNLMEITGQTVDEDIIDQIFKNFCLGK